MFFLAHQENGFFPANVKKVDWWLDRMLRPELIPPFDTGTRGVIGVIGNGRLEGLAVLAIGQFWYTDQKHLEEYVVFVDADCRGSPHCAALIDWMKEQSKLTGLPLFTGITSNKRTEAKVKLYRRLLPPVGAFFLYEPERSEAVLH